MTGVSAASAYRIEIDVRTQVRASLPVGQSRYEFPPAALLPGDGPATAGGDFQPATLLAAYRAGFFPWPHPGIELLWFSPDPRAVLPVGGLHVSRRLARTLRQGRFRVSLDGAFAAVITACADRAEGTWITQNYRRGYLSLHELGWAHSFEVWEGSELAGGLYGLRIGRLFSAESMFYRRSDASKVAMVALNQWAVETGVELIDIQQLTPHTESMGAVEIPRAEYIERLRRALR